MKTRVLSGIVATMILVGVLWSDWYLSGNALTLAIFLLALLGVYEFYAAMSKGGYKPIRTVGYVACIPLLFVGFDPVASAFFSGGDPFLWSRAFAFGIFTVLLLSLSYGIFQHRAYDIADIAVTFLGVFYVVFLFSFVILTRKLENGFFYLWFIFIGAWVTDTFAYFTGVCFGRTKFLPAISPHKTVEGSVGGVVGCTAVTVFYGLLVNRYIGGIELYHFFLLGLLSGVLSQIGDWSASAIKRYVNIKDYGSLMPGHGGVLDRFDSLLFIAPVVYFYIGFFVK